MDSQYQRELLVAFGALQNAARISQSIVSSTDKGVIEKDDLSPVTVADFAVQALLTATVKHAFPDDIFVGEESADDLRKNPILLDRVWELLLTSRASAENSPPSCTLPTSKEHMCDLIDQCGASSPGGEGSGRTWVFDPIDGTKTYVQGHLYAINIGLLVDGKQVLGAIGCPNLSITAEAPLGNADVDPSGEGCIAFAVKGHGAFMRPMKGGFGQAKTHKLPLHPSKPIADQEGEPVVRLVTCTTIVDSALPGIHATITSHLHHATVSCDLVAWVLRWVTLAMGLGDATFWVYKTPERRAKAWDHAGAMLLFEEAGGIVTDVRGRGIDLSAGRKLVRNTGFVAARGEDVHGRVLRSVREVLREQGRDAYLG